MKKRMHKLAAAAAAVMLLNAIPVTAFAAEEETPTVPKYTLDKDAFRSVLDKYSADIIKFAEPPETATEKSAVGEDVSAYLDSFTDDNDNEQNTLYICADAENQAVYAPADSSKLFAQIGGLYELDCTGLDTSNVTDMSYMFQYCGDKDTSAAPMNSLDLSGFDTSKVTDMSHMFEYCNIDGDLNILNFDVRNVTDMTDMFDRFKAENVYCYPRERFRYDTDGDMQGAYFAAPTDEYMICYNDYCTFSSKHHSEITKIKFIEPPVKSETDAVVGNKVYAQWEDETGTVYIYSDSPDKKVYASYDDFPFAQLEKLVEIDFTNFDTSKCQAFGNMFYECKKLKSLDLSGFDTRNAVDMYGMFVRLSSLEYLDVSSFDTSNVTEMTYMFDGLPVSEIDVSGFDTSKVTNMHGMFDGCASLTSLDLSSFDLSKVKKMDDMFRGTHLSTICCSEADYERYVNEGGLSLSTKRVDKLPVVSEKNAVLDKTIMKKAIQDTGADVVKFVSAKPEAELTETVLNEDGGVIGGFDAETKTLYIYAAEGGKVIAPENSLGLFSGTDLTEIDCSALDTSNVTNMSEMFISCHNLTTLDLSSFDTTKVTDMSKMFYECSTLTSLDLSNFDTTNVTTMGNMFENCRALTSLDLSSFDTSNVTTMEYMFYGCNALTSLDISNFDTSNVTSMVMMFKFCHALTSLDFSHFDTSNVTTMYYMFEECNALTTLDLSSFDTSNVIDMGGLFYNCENLTALDVSNFDFSSAEYIYLIFKGTNLATICCSEEDYQIYIHVSGLSEETERIEPVAEVLLTGDANCDGIVDISDAILLARYAAEDTTVSLTETGKLNADVSGDGKLTAEDTAYIIRIIAKLV